MSPFSLLLLLGTCSAFLYFDKVDDGVDKVYDGFDKVDDGIDEVDDGVDEVDDGVDKVDDGIDKVDDGIDKVDDGIDKIDDGVDNWPSLTSVFPPLWHSSVQRSPNAMFFHNSAWDHPIRSMLQPQPAFSWNRHNSGADSAFFGFSNSPFKTSVSPRPFPPFHIVRTAFRPNLLSRNKLNLDFSNHEVVLNHVSDIISPLLNFFNNYLDSSIEGASSEDDDSAIGSEKLDPSMEEDTRQRNVNLDENFEGDDIEMMDSNGSPNFNLSRDVEEDYEDEVVDTAAIGNARLPQTHFYDILEEILEIPEDDNSNIGTEKLDLSKEEDSQRNVNLDDILDEIFEGDDIEMMDPNVDKDYDDEEIDTAVIENARLPHIMEEIFENDDNEMLDSNVEKNEGFHNFSTTNYVKEDYEDEVINRTVIEHNSIPHNNVDDVLYEILENDNNEMLYPNVEKHSDLGKFNLIKDVKGDYDDDVIDSQPEIDIGNEIKNARQSQDESSNSTEENISHEFEPTITIFR